MVRRPSPCTTFTTSCSPVLRGPLIENNGTSGWPSTHECSVRVWTKLRHAWRGIKVMIKRVAGLFDFARMKDDQLGCYGILTRKWSWIEWLIRWTWTLLSVSLWKRLNQQSSSMCVTFPDLCFLVTADGDCYKGSRGSWPHKGWKNWWANSCPHETFLFGFWHSGWSLNCG